MIRFVRYAAPLALVLATAGSPASAQFFWGPPAPFWDGAPMVEDAPVPGAVVARILRARGYRLAGRPQIRGERIVAIGERPDGRRARFVIDAYDGALIRTTLLSEPREPRPHKPAARPAEPKAPPVASVPAQPAPPKPPLAPPAPQQPELPKAAPPTQVAPQQAPSAPAAQAPAAAAPAQPPVETPAPAADIGPQVKPVAPAAPAPNPDEPNGAP